MKKKYPIDESVFICISIPGIGLWVLNSQCGPSLRVIAISGRYTHAFAPCIIAHYSLESGSVTA